MRLYKTGGDRILCIVLALLCVTRLAPAQQAQPTEVAETRGYSVGAAEWRMPESWNEVSTETKLDEARDWVAQFPLPGWDFASPELFAYFTGPWPEGKPADDRAPAARLWVMRYPAQEPGAADFRAAVDAVWERGVPGPEWVAPQSRTMLDSYEVRRAIGGATYEWRADDFSSAQPVPIRRYIYHLQEVPLGAVGFLFEVLASEQRALAEARNILTSVKVARTPGDPLPHGVPSRRGLLLYLLVPIAIGILWATSVAIAYRRQRNRRR